MKQNTSNSPLDPDFTIRYLTTGDLDQYNALLRYAFQITEQELLETGWQDDEIKQSKFPVLERADVMGCFAGEDLVSQFAAYPLKMNIYGTSYPVAFLNISGIISSKSFKYTTSGLVWDTFPAVSATVVVSAAIVPAAVVVSEAAVVSAVFAPQPVMDAATISPAMVSAVSLIFFIMCFLLYG